MKLATFVGEGGSSAVGMVLDGSIVDLAEVAPTLPRHMIDLIQLGGTGLNGACRLASSARSRPLSSARLLPPIPRPPEFLGVGLNYRDHAREAGLEIPLEPLIFNKQTSCIVGPFDDVVCPQVSEQLDYEGELGLVIGRAGRNLSPEQAAAAIFGYVVVNDLSIRDWQFKSATVTLGKSFDTHGPFGPWIVTADEVADPQSLLLTSTVNGEVRQRASTADMIFGCCEIVAFLSRVMTLKPGTIVATGTPAGVGLFHRPPAYLRAGDVVSVEISGLGRLTNRVVDEKERGP